MPFRYYGQLFTLLQLQLLQDLDELQVILFDFKEQQLNFDLVQLLFIKLKLVLLLEFEFGVMLELMLLVVLMPIAMLELEFKLVIKFTNLTKKLVSF
jgi:hypothetical protein